MKNDESKEQVIALTERWLRDIVIGFNLCPFAKQPYMKGQVKIVVAESADTEEVFDFLIDEMMLLTSVEKSELETTLVVCPSVLKDFEDYLGFLDIANSALYELGFEGELQLASFHPDYRFADEDKHDQSNFTNRSPYPIFHIIREESLTQINENIEKIPERNIKLMREMSKEDLKEHFAWLFN